MDTTHYCFPQPTDSNSKVWKYLDLGKLIFMLSKKQLYLTRIDLLGDGFEGTLTKAFMEALEAFAKERNDKFIVNSVRQTAQLGRNSSYVNCWRMDEHESEAMWKLYCPNNQGVVLQTTYNKLVNSSSDKDLHIGMVTYIDYETGFFQAAENLFYSILHKRKAFEHEKEIRIVTTQHYMENKPLLPGKVFSWDISNCIENIYVNPYSESWYHDVITETLQAFNCKIKVDWSNMKKTPYLQTKQLVVTAARLHFLRSGGQMLYLDLAKNGRLAAERQVQVADIPLDK